VACFVARAASPWTAEQFNAERVPLEKTRSDTWFFNPNTMLIMQDPPSTGW
jgi:hypothetical protein